MQFIENAVGRMIPKDPTIGHGSAPAVAMAAAKLTAIAEGRPGPEWLQEALR